MIKIKMNKNGFKSFSKDLEQIKKNEKRKIVCRVGETPQENSIYRRARVSSKSLEESPIYKRAFIQDRRTNK